MVGGRKGASCMRVIHTPSARPSFDPSRGPSLAPRIFLRVDLRFGEAAKSLGREGPGLVVQGVADHGLALRESPAVRGPFFP